MRKVIEAIEGHVSYFSFCVKIMIYHGFNYNQGHMKLWTMSFIVRFEFNSHFGMVQFAGMTYVSFFTIE